MKNRASQFKYLSVICEVVRVKNDMKDDMKDLKEHFLLFQLCKTETLEEFNEVSLAFPKHSLS